MPSLTTKMYSSMFKILLRQGFLGREIPMRKESRSVPPNASFFDGVATKDVVINETTGLSIRIFLPDYAIQIGDVHGYSWMARQLECKIDGEERAAEQGVQNQKSRYNGYIPEENQLKSKHKLPVLLQFHAGAFVVGRKDSVANDSFCRLVAKVCNSVVIAVGYRLAPEHKWPAAIDDGCEALKWLDRQAELTANETSPRQVFRGQEKSHLKDFRSTATTLVHNEIVDPWLASHADFSHVVLLGADSGGNIADQISRRIAVDKEEFNALEVLGQILLYPLWSGITPTASEVIKGNSSLFIDKSTLSFIWQLYMSDDVLSLDHPAINPLIEEAIPLHGEMPNTLIVSAEHDMLRDRCIAYVEALKKFGSHAQIYDYADMVHGFATSELFLNSPQARGCVEDISVWMYKLLSPKGEELSY